MTELRHGTPADAGMLPERVDRVRDLAAGWVKEEYTPAMCVLVARRGVIVLHEAFGVLTPDDDAPPLQRDSIFPVSSVTKTITATLVMQLVEDGRIGLNRPVVEYVPELSGEGKDQILLHHLLTHTSGLREEEVLAFPLLRDGTAPDLPPCPATQHPVVHQTLHAYHEAPLSRRPGELMEYCTYGYLLLAEVVRRVSGRALDDLARERVFAPLGMTDSWLVVPESVRSRIVRRRPDAPWAAPEIWGWQGLNSREAEETPWADRGLYSTARDLAVLTQTFLNGGTYGSARILSRPSVDAMTRNQIPGTRFEFVDKSGPAAMGYGWFVEHEGAKWLPFGSLQSLRAANHMGAGGSVVWFDPTHELVGVYLEVLLRQTEQREPLWNFPLFQNAVTASVAD